MLYKFNLFLFLLGFLIFNMINFVFGTNLISSFEYRIFQVFLALYTFVYYFINNSKKFKVILNDLNFRLYIIFSTIYLSKVFIDVFINDIKVDEDPLIIFLTAFSYIIIIPFSLLSITEVNNKIVKEMYISISILFIIRIILEPIVISNSFQRHSAFDSLGVQSLGFYASILFVWSIICFISSDKKFYYKLFDLLISYLSLYFLSISGTRSTFFAAILIIIVYILTKLSQIKTKNVFLIIILIITFIVLYNYYAQWVSVILYRFERGLTTGNLTGRGAIFPIALDMFSDSPLIGSHHIVPPNGPWFHNYLLDAFVTTGVIGGVLFLLLNIRILKKSFKFMLNRYDQISLFFSVCFILSIMYGMFIGNLFSTPFYWGFVAILIILSKKSVLKL